MGSAEPFVQVDLDGQYRELREGAGWLERPRGFLLVAGPDGAEYLQGQLTNDIEALAPGEGAYAALLDRKGRMQTDLRVLRISPDEILLDCVPIGLEPLRRHLSMYAVGRDVRVSDPAAQLVVLSLIGPAATALTGLHVGSGEHSHAQAHLGKAAFRAVRTDLGFDLLCEPEELAALQAALDAAGVARVDARAAEVIRVETGRPCFGKDMGPATIPQEAGLNERAVSFTKGCYIGQETVARLHYKGKPNRHLRGLRLEASAHEDEPIRLDEREVGRIGSAVVSPALGPLALAIVRREAEPGARVEVGEANAAIVEELPFAPSRAARDA